MNDSKIARFSRFDRALTRARAFRRSQFHAGAGVGTGKDFTLFALRDGEVMFKVGANKKKFVTVVDAVDRSGRADGQPTRKDKRKAMYSPRAVVRAARGRRTTRGDDARQCRGVRASSGARARRDGAANVAASLAAVVRRDGFATRDARCDDEIAR